MSETGAVPAACAVDPVGPLLTEFAPAKVNLALHVVGRRPDGYHLLDSLVVFAGVGDRLEAAPARALTLAIEGPFGVALRAEPENSVLKAARKMVRRRTPGAALRLVKDLPVASGLGGGSADAAAALRLLARFWEVPLPTPAETFALGLGADVPVCLVSRPARMRGVGEELAPAALPPFWMTLVNPGVPVSTPAVFKALTCRENPPLPDPPAFADAPGLFAWLRATRNDLEPPALAAAPVIAEALAALAAQPGCALARMSGSGATCFGLFAAEAEARAAETALRAARPGWWVAAAPSLAG